METVRLFHEAHQAAARLDRQSMRNAVIELLSASNGTPDFWHRLIDFASSVGEGGAAIEAARRFASIDSRSLQPQTMYRETLAEFGREEQALTLLQQLPEPDQKHPAAAYLLGLLYAQNGEFAEAENWLRCVVEAGVSVDAAWFTLSGLKKFTPDDPDLAEMRLLATHLAGQDRRRASRIGYAIGKAEWDIGEFDASLDTITAAADLQRSLQAFDPERHDAFVERVIKSFDGAALDSLTPSRMQGSRALFVTGLPRSGTTLAERLLAAHPDVRSGGEVNLWGYRLFQTETPDIEWARERDPSGDAPGVWEKLASAYSLLMWNQFPEARYVVDKTLLQTQWMGLILHALPDARVIYVKRDPVDTAWSCYRSLFPGSLPWTHSLRDIGRYFAAEAALLKHWQGIYGDRILTVNHADLVHSPLGQSERMMQHFNLRPPGEQLNSGGKPLRIKTASMFQARQEVDRNSSGNSLPIRERLLPELRAGIEASPFKDGYSDLAGDRELEPTT